MDLTAVCIICNVDEIRTLLDSGAEWFLESITFDGHTLRVRVVEGIGSTPPTELELGGHNLGPSREITIEPESRRLDIEFGGVAASQVILESLATPAAQERSTPGRLRRYEQSAYLDFMRASTLLATLHEGQLTHYGLALADHVVDVVCGAEPRAKIVR